MDISVVMPLYNGERYVAAALDSVMQQVLLPREIVVVDDGSTDGGAGIAARYPTVRMLVQHNAGCATARNAGVTASDCPIIAFLDADDLWLPQRLARAHAVLTADAELDFVVCAQRNFVTPDLAQAPAWVEQAMLDHPQPGFSTNTLMVRRSSFARVGPFDPAFFPIDDTEWLVRALDAGMRHVHLDDVLVSRRLHDSNITGSIRGKPAHGVMMARILQRSLARRRTEGAS